MPAKRSQYNIAIDGLGLILNGTPEKPQRKLNTATVFGNRFASGDRDYTDFSIWWYWAQTDWANGIKEEIEWEDDAKYYYSTNIDPFSKPGSFKLTNALTQTEDFGNNIQAGINGVVGGTATSYIGEDDGSGDAPRVHSSTNENDWTNISDGSWPAGKNTVSAFQIKDDILWAFLIGSAGTFTVNYWDGSSWFDVTANIDAGASLDHTPNITTASAILGQDLYIAVENNANDYYAIVKTSTVKPTIDGDWSKIIDRDTNARIVAMESYLGDIYYLVANGSIMELHQFDVSASTDNIIEVFNNTTSQIFELTDRYLHVLEGKLIITLPASEIWELNGTTLTQIYKNDDAKKAIGNEAIAPSLIMGGTKVGSKIYWSNLVYDGEFFFNFIKKSGDDDDTAFVPLFSNEGGVIFGIQSDIQDGARSQLFKYDSSVFKSTVDANFLQYSEMSDVSTIDKLANAIRIIFDPLEEGESIKVDYSIDGGTTFTTLGTASFSVDGGSVSQKLFYFGDEVDFRKIIFKVYLNSDGSSSPDINDISLQYVPIPDYKFDWELSFLGYDNFNILNERSKDKNKGIDIRNKLRASFLNKKVVALEDIDYFETKLDGAFTIDDTTMTVDTTEGASETGRLRVENEEIRYTGKTATAFTGLTRGYRGTEAAAHDDNIKVSTEYKVIIVGYSESTPTANEANAEEFIISVKLIEV